MSKPIRTRLKLLESVTMLMAAASYTLSKFRHGTRQLIMSVATAQTFNLPKATGKNGAFRLYVGITASGNKVIKANGTDVIQGLANIQTSVFQTASNTNTITLNGTTTGGVIGGYIDLFDEGLAGGAVGQWRCEINSPGSGTAATPFSNT